MAFLIKSRFNWWNFWFILCLMEEKNLWVCGGWTVYTLGVTAPEKTTLGDITDLVWINRRLVCQVPGMIWFDLLVTLAGLFLCICKHSSNLSTFCRNIVELHKTVKKKKEKKKKKRFNLHSFLWISNQRVLEALTKILHIKKCLPL